MVSSVVEALPVMVKRLVVLFQRKLEESIRVPPVLAKGMRPEVRLEIAREVVVAFVVVAFMPVKFWSVVEELARSCWKEETRVVEVAVKYEARTKSSNEPGPTMESFQLGVVVPMPMEPFVVKFPFEVVVALPPTKRLLEIETLVDGKSVV